MSGWWPGCCCGGPGLIYRVDSSGNLVWKSPWGPNYSEWNPWGDVRNSPAATCVSVDVANEAIYVGGYRSADEQWDSSTAYSVRKLDADGNILWSADVGTDVNAILYVPGQGVLVAHALTYDVADDLVYVMSATGTTEWFIDDDIGFNSLSMTASAATIQAQLEAVNARLSGNISVSGTSFNAGLTFHFDSSLAGPTGLRRVAVNADFSGALTAGPRMTIATTSSMRNLTLLDPDDGTELSHILITVESSPCGFISIPVPTCLSLVGSSVFVGHNSVYHDLTATSSAITGNVTEIDFSSAPNTRHLYFDSAFARSSVPVHGMDTDGANLFLTRVAYSGYARQIAKYDGSFSRSWLVDDYINPVTCDGTDAWAVPEDSQIDLEKLATSDGSLSDTVTVSVTAVPQHAVHMAAGTLASIGGDGGTIRMFDSGGSLLWSFFGDAQRKGRMGAEYDGDVIVTCEKPTA